MPRKAGIKKKQTGLWHRSRIWEKELLLWMRKPIPYLQSETIFACVFQTFYTKRYLLVMMNQETLNIPCMARNRNLISNPELITNSLK